MGIVDGSEDSSINKDFSSDSVKLKLSKIIPQVSQRNFLNKPNTSASSQSNGSYSKSCQHCAKLFVLDKNNEESKKLFDIHTSNCGKKLESSVSSISDESEEEIEFVTTVTADDKKQEKRKSEDFSF